MTPEARKTLPNFRLFPLGWDRDEDFLAADLLEEAGFREVTGGGPNYGPVHHSGQISEHHTNWRLAVVEEETLCIGLAVVWHEFPGSGAPRWHFQLHHGEFPPGFEIHPNLVRYESQGRAPHFWKTQDAIDGPWKQMSRIVYGGLEHLRLIWEQKLATFDRPFIERFQVAMDALREDREVLRFIARTHWTYADPANGMWHRPAGFEP